MGPRPPLSRGKRKGGNPDIVPAECPLRWGPCCGSGATLAPGPSLSYPSFSRRKPGPRDHGALDGNQKDIGPPRALRHGGCCFSRELKHRAGGVPTALRSVLWQLDHRGPWTPAFLPLVFPAKAGTQGPRSTGRQPKGHRAARGLCGTESAIFLKPLGHRAGGSSTALRSALWLLDHRGSWAPAFAGETNGACTRTPCRRSARCTGSVLWQRHHRGFWAPAFLPLVFPANAGIHGPRSIGRQPRAPRPARALRHEGCFLFKRTRASCRRSAQCAEVRSVAAGPPRPLDPRFPTPRFPGEGRDTGTTEHWTATKRTSGHPSLRSTESALFLKPLRHRASRKPTALRSTPWQLHYRGS